MAADDAEAQIAARLKDAEDRMERSIESLHKELGAVRTGRATPALVERVQVEYYGTLTPLQQLANISAPEARLLVIQPYDKGSIQAIEKAIQKGEQGLNPSNDGQLIRIQIPQLTEERRRDFVKLCKAKGEDARVSIRNIRRDEVEHLRKLEKDGVSRDQVEGSLAQVQRVTDRFVAQVDAVVNHKEAEILEV